ncbi:hypothetical protein ACNAN0_02330 [Agrilactobacillus fermenti]|uniref:hypothetical protein n=1 Tax=Agrilactobacillus fermenti TaxID=2586909 RepID=UPI001E2E61BE|nr:hypothetical protein [Agrilactobacillus fermenti]MCD2257106.1 hypothetical protein [Agrilactobacillus fermenti]
MNKKEKVNFIIFNKKDAFIISAINTDNKLASKIKQTKKEIQLQIFPRNFGSTDN